MDDPGLIAEASAVMGRAPVAVERLAHSRHGVTVGVWLVRTTDGAAIRKVVAPRAEAGPGALVPSSFRYWRREPLLLTDGLPEAYLAAGIGAPRLLGSFEEEGRSVALWTEAIVGTAGGTWDTTGVELACRRLGRAQGRLAIEGGWHRPWLSRGFLREYLVDAETHSPMDLLDDDDAWASALVGETFPAGLRRHLVELHRSRDRLLGLLGACPRTLCHLDFWPANLFEVGGRTVAIDWSFAGDGALGEDIGNLVPDSIFDLHYPSSWLPELDRASYRGYVAGLRDAGWTGDERLVRLAVCASAVKYEWLAASMLRRSNEPDSLGYGGTAVDGRHLFAERAAGLAYLVERAAEAERLGLELGI